MSGNHIDLATSRDELSEDHQARLSALRANVTGKPSEGRIAYEQLGDRARSNGRGTHCYNLGLAYQKPKTMTGVASTMKKSIPVPLDLPKEVLKVSPLIPDELLCLTGL
jgi:hypothetical protein